MAKKWKQMTEAEFERQNRLATARGKRAIKNEIQARGAHFDRKTQHLVVDLKNGATLALPAQGIQGLRNAPGKLIAQVELGPRGASLHWEELDADLSVAGLLRGALGSKAWMAELGRQGGHSTSPAKQEASRKNGRKGGRPRLIDQTRSRQTSSHERPVSNSQYRLPGTIDSSPVAQPARAAKKALKGRTILKHGRIPRRTR